MTTHFRYGANEAGPVVFSDLPSGVVADFDDACHKLVGLLLGHFGQDVMDDGLLLTEFDLKEIIHGLYLATFEVNPDNLPFRKWIAGVEMFIETTEDPLYDPASE